MNEDRNKFCAIGSHKKIQQGNDDANCGLKLLNYLSALITRVHQIRPLGSICLRVCKYVFVNICRFSCFLIAWRMSSASSFPYCECVSHKKTKSKASQSSRQAESSITMVTSSLINKRPKLGKQKTSWVVCSVRVCLFWLPHPFHRI